MRYSPALKYLKSNTQPILITDPYYIAWNMTAITAYFSNNYYNSQHVCVVRVRLQKLLTQTQFTGLVIRNLPSNISPILLLEAITGIPDIVAFTVKNSKMHEDSCIVYLDDIKIITSGYVLESVYNHVLGYSNRVRVVDQKRELCFFSINDTFSQTLAIELEPHRSAASISKKDLSKAIALRNSLLNNAPQEPQNVPSSMFFVEPIIFVYLTPVTPVQQPAFFTLAPDRAKTVLPISGTEVYKFQNNPYNH